MQREGVISEAPKNKQYRVLLITDCIAQMAGSEKNVAQLVCCSDQHKFQFAVASFQIGDVAETIRKHGVEVFKLNSSSLYSPPGLKNLQRLSKFVRETGIDLIVTYHEGSDFLGLALAKICCLPVITSRRDMGFNTGLHHSLTYKILGRCFDAVIAVSQAVKNEVVKRHWFPESKITVIHNGVNLEDYAGNSNDSDGIQSIRTTLGLSHHAPLVGVIANLRKIKGLKPFIEAAAILVRENPEAVFLIVGADLNEPGYTRRDLESFAAQRGVSRNIHFLESPKNVPSLISQLDIGVVSSLSEGFSNVVLEYMASSKPVIATRVGGNPEAVIEGETGYLVPPGDPRALATAIGRLFANRELGQRLGKAGRRRVEAIYNVYSLTRQCEAIFEQAILQYGSLAERGRRFSCQNGS